MSDPAYLKEYEKELNAKFGIVRADSATPKVNFNKSRSLPFTMNKGYNNERLLDELDELDDNLVDDSFHFSFTRVSLLDVADRNSIIHGPSFKGNKEITERLSIKRQSGVYRKSMFAFYNFIPI